MSAIIIYIICNLFLFSIIYIILPNILSKSIIKFFYFSKSGDKHIVVNNHANRNYLTINQKYYVTWSYTWVTTKIMTF